MKFRVTSTALNAGNLAYESVRSVMVQTCQDWTLHFFDARSEDDTLKMANAARTMSGKPDRRVKVTGEYLRTSGFHKLVPLWKQFDDDDVIVWLDGDDVLAHPRVLEELSVYYGAGATATYGQFLWQDGTAGFAAPAGPDPRSEPWRATHLKTFQAKYIKAMRPEDFRDDRGNYLTLALDQAIMLPVLEMSGPSAVFVPKVLYYYNNAHSYYDNATPEQKQAELDTVRLIRSRPRYGELR
jgi:glycosyltransferase involved in cell wall biosynthesis